jgi:hypothetical protein
MVGNCKRGPNSALRGLFLHGCHFLPRREDLQGRPLGRYHRRSDRVPSPLAARTSTIGSLAQLAPEFFPERLRCPIRPIASGHFPGPLERMTFGGVIADPDNDVPMERACGCGTGRLQRVAHGRGQIVGMVVHRHRNLQPAPKGGQQAARQVSPRQRGDGRERSPSGFETSPGSPN